MTLYKFPKQIIEEASRLISTCETRGLTLAVAESCTGGLIATILTEIPGASVVFDRGFVTYSNEAKSELLGIPMALIAEHGAVSEAVAGAMAEGALARSSASLSASVTGIAGPGGATPTKPVGLVYVGAARRGSPALVTRHLLEGDRPDIRLAAVRVAFAQVGALVD
jgi:nicotinamide-nucleotide amidase